MKKELGEYFLGTKINLGDTFYVEQKDILLEGENMVYCNHCQKLNRFIYQKEIYGLPSELIIILDRAKNNQDFNEEFEFF